MKNIILNFQNLVVQLFKLPNTFFDFYIQNNL